MRTAQRGETTRSGLTSDELAQQRAMLEQQLGFRLEQLAALARPGRPGPLGSADGEVTASLEAGARAALREVRAALARMATASYGRCTRCAAPLGRERLEILPQTAMCMPCQRNMQPAVRSTAGRGADTVANEAVGNGRAEG